MPPEERKIPCWRLIRKVRAVRQSIRRFQQRIEEAGAGRQPTPLHPFRFAPGSRGGFRAHSGAMPESSPRFPLLESEFALSMLDQGNRGNRLQRIAAHQWTQRRTKRPISFGTRCAAFDRRSRETEPRKQERRPLTDSKMDESETMRSDLTPKLRPSDCPTHGFRGGNSMSAWLIA